VTPETTALIEQLLTKHKIVDVPGWVRVKSGEIISYAQVLEVYCRIAKTKLGRTQIRPPRPHMALPPDFAHHALSISSEALAKRYGCSVETVARFRREVGVEAPRPLGNLKPRTKRPMPEGFAVFAPQMSVAEIRAKTGASSGSVRRWLDEAGVSTRAPARHGVLSGRSPMGFLSRAADRGHRDHTRDGEAADYLRRFGPVYRCRANGRADPKGSHWCRGSTVLTAQDVIQRAVAKGFNPNAWQDLPA
jgi:hypothetical protein